MVDGPKVHRSRIDATNAIIESLEIPVEQASGCGWMIKDSESTYKDMAMNL